MLDPGAWDQVADAVGAEDFYRADHRLIFTAMGTLVEHGSPPDPLTISDELTRQGQLEAAGGLDYLAGLLRDTPSAANVRAYARIVREHAARRRLHAIGEKLAAANGENVPDLATRAIAEIERVTKDLDGADERDSADSASYPKLDPCAYHGLAGDIVRAIEPHTEADPVALLVQFLAAAGNMIGRGPHYLVEATSHHANFFAVLVGTTAKGRKGTAWDRIREVFTCADDRWAHDSVQGGLSSGEGLIHAVRDGTDEDPGVSDKRLLILESEYAGLLQVMSRRGNIVSRIIRDAWDRGDLRTMSKHCPARATGAHISIVGHITADELVRYLDRTECANGFANRFLFALVKRSKYLPHGGALDPGALLPLSRRLAETISRARELGRVRMDDEAMRRWEAVYPTLSDARPGLLGAVTARAEAQTVRLALLYALLDGADYISVTHLRAALAVWEYCEASARVIFGDALGDPIADAIARALRSSSGGLTRTEISRVLGRNAPAQRIEAALHLLSGARMAQATKAPSSGGRPAERWVAC